MKIFKANNGFYSLRTNNYIPDTEHIEVTDPTEIEVAIEAIAIRRVTESWQGSYQDARFARRIAQTVHERKEAYKVEENLRKAKANRTEEIEAEKGKIRTWIDPNYTPPVTGERDAKGNRFYVK